ncbi:MAG: hypothetical protein NTY07_03300 [Bacteroidia bacterium]|nr:hypothetical protein [Bacteroidia bacterium]
MKKILIALDYDRASPKFAEDNITESAIKTAKSLHGNIIVKGSQNRKWLEKYCHGKCYGRSFTSHFNTAFHHSNQIKKMNIVVVLKQGYSNQILS